MQLFEPPVHLGHTATHDPQVGAGGVGGVGGAGGAGGVGGAGVGAAVGPDHAAASCLKNGWLRGSSNPKLISQAPAPSSLYPSCLSKSNRFWAVIRPCDWPT